MLFLSFPNHATSYDELDRIKEIISFKSCEVKLNNGSLRTDNCTYQEKKKNTEYEIDRQKRISEYNQEQKIKKQINKVFEKIF